MYIGKYRNMDPMGVGCNQKGFPPEFAKEMNFQLIF